MAAGLFLWLGATVSYAQDIGISISSNPAEVTEPLTVTVTVANNTGGPLTTIPLALDYDANFISYDSVTGANPASDDQIDDGTINWTNVVSGSLAAGDTLQVIVHMVAKAATTGETGCVGTGTNVTCLTGTSAGTPGTLEVSINEPIGKYSIAGFIWHDIDNDGDDPNTDANEPYLPNVVVSLYRDAPVTGTPGLWDAGDVLITTTLSAAITGAYTFADVVGDGSTYFVRLDPSNFAPGGALEGYTISNTGVVDVATNSQAVPNFNAPVTDVNFGLFCRFDLALMKQLTAPVSGVIAPGDDVTFTLTIFNQGVVTATNIVVTDYLPAGFTLSAASTATWSGVGPVTTLLPGPLAGGDSTTVDIVLTAGAATSGTYTNTAEISSADSSAKDALGNNFPDADSTPDSVNGNTSGEVAPDLEDDQVNEDGTAGNDEDDHDIAPVRVDVFDLALRKSNSTPTWVAPGGDVTFTLTIFNQGNVDAANVMVVDYLPSGFTLSAASAGTWVSGSGLVTTTLPGTLAASTSTTVDIVLTASSSVSGRYTNTAEIASATDIGGTPQIDVDSTLDNQNGNDPGEIAPVLEDDQTGENGKNVPGDDEDDHDIGTTTILVFDLALQKSAGTPGNIAPNDDVTFTLTIFNQGTITATNMTVVDYLPAEFTLSSANGATWIDNGTGVVTTTIAGPLSGGSSTTVDIVLTASAIATGTYTNTAEIAAADSVLKDPNGNNVPDIDSTPDNQNTESPVKDDVLDEDALTNPGVDDEDDHDPGIVIVTRVPVNPKLKITKVRNGPNPFGVSSSVSFTILITNTGDVTITVLPLEDSYNNAFLSYDNTNPPSPLPNIGSGNGVLVWSDLLAANPFYPNGLGISETISLDVYFTTLADTTQLTATPPCTADGEVPNMVHVQNAMADADGIGGLPAIRVPEDADDHDCASVEVLNPTAVALANRGLIQQTDGVMVRWGTVSESTVAGFHIWKSNGAHAVQLTSTMITAKNSGQSSGAAYEWLHTGATLNRGDLYMLELIHVDGTAERAVIDVVRGVSIYLPLLQR